jgi:hypothetical protein
MQLSIVIAEIDSEIARLKQARTLLAEEGEPAIRKADKAKSAASSIEVSNKHTKKRNLSPEGRKRIAEAVRRRWELQKKAASR